MLQAMGKKLWAEQRGFTVSTVDGWMARKWTKGVQYRVEGHQTIIIVEAADAWLVNGRQESDHPGGVSALPSTAAGLNMKLI